MHEDWGSDFGPIAPKGKGKSSQRNSKTDSCIASKTSMDFFDEEFSEDELDFLSHSSRAGSSSPRRRSAFSQDQERSDGVIVDGEFHPWAPGFSPPKTKFPNFKKKKKDAPPKESEQGSSSTARPATRAAKEGPPLRTGPPMLVDSATRPKHKVLGMRPIKNETNPYAARKADVEKTPKPVKRAPRPFPSVVPPPEPASDSEREELRMKYEARSKGKEKAQDEEARSLKVKPKNKAQDFPMDISTSLKDMTTHADSDSDSPAPKARVMSKSKTNLPRAFPMEISSPAEKSIAAPKPVPKPFPLIAAVGSQNSTRSEPLARKSPPQRSPIPSSGLVSKSSPPPASMRRSPRTRRPTMKAQAQKESTTTRAGPASRKTGARKRRVVSSSSNADSSEDSEDEGKEQTQTKEKEKNKQKPKPFPMQSQLLRGLDSPPSKSKRISLDNMSYDRETKRIKGPEQMYVAYMLLRCILLGF